MPGFAPSLPASQASGNGFAVAVEDVLAEVVDVVHRIAVGEEILRDLLDLSVFRLVLLHHACAHRAHLAGVRERDHAGLRQHGDPELHEPVFLDAALAFLVAEVELAVGLEIEEGISALRAEIAGRDRELQREAAGLAAMAAPNGARAASNRMADRFRIGIAGLLGLVRWATCLLSETRNTKQSFVSKDLSLAGVQFDNGRSGSRRPGGSPPDPGRRRSRFSGPVRPLLSAPVPLRAGPAPRRPRHREGRRPADVLPGDRAAGYLPRRSGALHLVLPDLPQRPWPTTSGAAAAVAAASCCWRISRTHGRFSSRSRLR